jgi:hypothetical protein
VETRPALLVIADIGGYTAFMKLHRTSLAHAQDIVARLLEAVIDAAPGLTLLEIEGDAAFFYTWPRDQSASAQLAADAVVAMHRAFHTCQEGIKALNRCSCQGCAQGKELRVKFVAHLGEVAVQRVKRVSKLVGLDVILVHRMLKNTVPLPEYMLLSEPLFDLCNDSIRARTNPLPQEFEGLGSVLTYFFDIQQMAATLPPKPKVTKMGVFLEHWGLVLRSLPYLLGMKRPRFGLSVRAS